MASCDRQELRDGDIQTGYIGLVEARQVLSIQLNGNGSPSLSEFLVELQIFYVILLAEVID